VLDSPQDPLPAGSRRRRSFRVGLRFTRRAKKCVELALREARRLGHDQIAPEHILLGIIREADGLACQILAAKQPVADLRDRLLAELDKAA
jgi:ATP-dependent Clp protease ATP-binding subunit ClpA